MMRITCRGVTKVFNGVAALKGVDLELGGPELVAIIGPNGAGKSTLLNVISGSLVPDEGSCFLGGVDATGLAPWRIARLGLARTFQSVRLVFSLTAVENLMLASSSGFEDGLSGAFLRKSSYRGKDRQVAMRQLLRRVGLEEFCKVPAAELSFGQQKLLALAVSIATDAEALLLDEPISGLDPVLCTLAIDRVKEEAAAGKSVVFIEHDLDAVRQCADRVILLDGGQIAADGTVDQVLSSPEILHAFFP